ncbi:glycosyltransferase family protein [Winogradskyella aurantiaca]|uniref:glycosyl transferase family 1 n=1 Tax=Winogradskyella aurantiaca TaxID=2219558 RepID=UPI000E1DF68A|nr:glycosyl transferase family 1 [Winogradskyella aurantiaca]
MSQKHVLIITYYWPPAGGPGVQRWLKFCKYLPENGITPIVYCPENPTYPIEDKSLVDEIPEGIEVVKSPISEPYKWSGMLSKKSTKAISSGIISDTKSQSLTERLMLFVRGNFFIPDARKNWVKPSVKILSTLIKDRSINTVITTGPPHSLHLIGLELKETLKINWLADFRDPWTSIGYHKSLKLLSRSRVKHKALEKKVLNTADGIIVTSNNTRSEFAALTNIPLEVITNGYDAHDIPKQELDNKFTISHIGSLLSNRNPKILWEALSEMVLENAEFESDLQINLVGVISEDVIAALGGYGLSNSLNVIGYVSHKEAIKCQLRSQLLLLIEIDSEETKAIIPGKLFEYLQSDRPILALGPEGSDVERILFETNAGKYFYYKQKEGLKNHLKECYLKYKDHNLINHPIGLKQFSRRELTKKLASVIQSY